MPVPLHITYVVAIADANIPVFRGFWGQRFIGIHVGLLNDRLAEAATQAVLSPYLYPDPVAPFEQPLDAMDLLGLDCGRPHYTGEHYYTSFRERLRGKWDFWTGDPKAGMLEEFVAAGFTGTTLTVPRDWADRTDELLDLCIPAANQYKAMFNQHGVNITHHFFADAVIATANATNLASLLTLVNEIRTQVINHFGNVPSAFHSAPDTDSTILGAASDITTAAALMDNLYGAWNRHQARGDIHRFGLPDLTSYFTLHPDTYWSRFFLHFPAGSHPLTGPGVEWDDVGPTWGDGDTVWGPEGGTPDFYGLVRRLANTYKPAEFVCWDAYFELPDLSIVTIQLFPRYEDAYYHYILP